VTIREAIQSTRFGLVEVQRERTSKSESLLVLKSFIG
jgi:hypothetical protein